MTRIFNRIEEKGKRRKLRNNLTVPEKLLWKRIRRRSIRGKRFLRQFSVGKYVIDFYCPEIKLAIEVDGEIHYLTEVFEYDIIRQKEIENIGIRFLRFDNKDIVTDIDEVIKKIGAWIDTTPLNPPFYKGGKSQPHSQSAEADQHGKQRRKDIF